jgi:hypothetical protein
MREIHLTHVFTLDLRLCRFFGQPKGLCPRAEVAYDTEVDEVALTAELDKIRPWTETAPATMRRTPEPQV